MQIYASRQELWGNMWSYRIPRSIMTRKKPWSIIVSQGNKALRLLLEIITSHPLQKVLASMAVAPKLGIIIREWLYYCEVVFSITETSIRSHRLLQDSEYCIERRDLLNSFGVHPEMTNIQDVSLYSQAGNIKRCVTHACEPWTKFIEADVQVPGVYIGILFKIKILKIHKKLLKLWLRAIEVSECVFFFREIRLGSVYQLHI